MDSELSNQLRVGSTSSTDKLSSFTRSGSFILREEPTKLSSSCTGLGVVRSCKNSRRQDMTTAKTKCELGVCLPWETALIGIRLFVLVAGKTLGFLYVQAAKQDIYSYNKIKFLNNQMT